MGSDAKCRWKGDKEKCKDNAVNAVKIKQRRWKLRTPTDF